MTLLAYMPINNHLGRINRAVLAALLSTALLACSTTGSTPTGPTAPPPATPQPCVLEPYLQTLSDLAPGDATRQAAALAAALAAAQASATPSNTLRYALALGSAGHPGSNPVEARNLLSELLAGSPPLSAKELELANAYLREFDARVAQYAELARQREETEQKLQAQETSADRRENALEAENARLRRALEEANRKLEAVAEMEQLLLDQSVEPKDAAPE